MSRNPTAMGYLKDVAVIGSREAELGFVEQFVSS